MHQVGEYEESNSINGYLPVDGTNLRQTEVLCGKKRVMKPPPEGTVEMVMWDRDIFSLS